MVEDGFDQSAIIPSHMACHDRKVSIDGREARKGIDLQKVGGLVFIDTDVHSRYITAFQNTIGPEGCLLDFLLKKGIDGRWATVKNSFLPFPFHLQGIDGFLRRSPLDLNLHDTEDSGFIIAEDAYRKFGAADKLLD
jgi:hypothetical protein